MDCRRVYGSAPRLCRGRALGRLDLDRGPVLQLAHRAERPDDHLVPFLHARQRLEVLLAGDAGFHRGEQRLVVAHDEDALELLALLARLQLRGLHAAAAAALRTLALVADDVPL